MVGGVKSRVLVTTRSKGTVLVVDDKYKYELTELSPENSWRLFEMTAFGEKGNDINDVNTSELIKLGKQIVEKCSNLPLAIRIVGTLLYGQNESMWRSFQEYGLANFNNGENKIMSILKLSYDNLESSLKACFSYCSLFPKDFKIKKEKLIRLWIAQGYIEPFYVGQSLEEAAEESFLILLRRCFFQGIEMNEIGGVESFRIHDLMHDVAKKEAGKDVVSLNFVANDLGDDVHHVFHLGSTCRGSFFPKCKIRSYVRDGFEINFPVVQLLENWNFLRTLDLHDLDIQTLPDSIGKLLHLRYLDLSYNKHLKLSDSVTKLYNLQTLDLNSCYYLTELPEGLAKLVNLRHLDISRCNYLSRMPPGLDKLSCLCVLTDFLVGEGVSSSLESLQALTNLRGSIHIRTARNLSSDTESSKSKEGYLRRMKHLETLVVTLSFIEKNATLLEKLEPPPSLKVLKLFSYDNTSLPTRWWQGELNFTTFLPNLVYVEFHGCRNLLHLPALSKLLHLKSLSLYILDKLEYMEDTNREIAANTFFPSLEYLKLSYVKALKGWWKREELNRNAWQPSFIKLSELEIDSCPYLASFPACPRLEKLTLRGVHKHLPMSLGKEEGLIKLRDVHIDNLDYLKSLPTESLTSFCLSANNDLESFSLLGETIFKRCFTLRSLIITYCNKLKSLNGGGWEHLTSLECLIICHAPRLTFSGRGSSTDNNAEDDNDGIPWRILQGSLRSLEFEHLEIKTLPQGMRYLTSLQNLKLTSCEKLECLPEWISCLPSLRSLQINYCESLRTLPGHLRDLSSLQFLQVLNCPLITKRFQDPNGDDWLNLRHIPTVDIR
ncbi:hypothetical protein RND81_O271000 [Saponaria officinalis]